MRSQLPNHSLANVNGGGIHHPNHEARHLLDAAPHWMNGTRRNLANIIKLSFYQEYYSDTTGSAPRLAPPYYGYPDSDHRRGSSLDSTTQFEMVSVRRHGSSEEELVAAKTGWHLCSMMDCIESHNAREAWDEERQRLTDHIRLSHGFGPHQNTTESGSQDRTQRIAYTESVLRITSPGQDLFFEFPGTSRAPAASLSRAIYIYVCPHLTLLLSLSLSLSLCALGLPFN